MSNIITVIIIIFAFVIIFILYFHRHPNTVSAHPGYVISPANGKVIGIKPGKIKLFLSIFDIHAQYMPFNGSIRRIERVRKGASVMQIFHIDTWIGPIKIKQKTGVFVRRLVSCVRPGDSVWQGQQIGFIRFGSGVDIILPPTVQIAPINIGMHIRIGDPIGKIKIEKK